MKKTILIILAVVLGLFTLFCLVVSLSGCGDSISDYLDYADIDAGTDSNPGIPGAFVPPPVGTVVVPSLETDSGASCTCYPRPDLGINDTLACGTHYCMSNNTLWQCQLSGWVELYPDC